MLQLPRSGGARGSQYENARTTLQTMGDSMDSQVFIFEDGCTVILFFCYSGSVSNIILKTMDFVIFGWTKGKAQALNN